MKNIGIGKIMLAIIILLITSCGKRINQDIESQIVVENELSPMIEFEINTSNLRYKPFNNMCRFNDGQVDTCYYCNDESYLHCGTYYHMRTIHGEVVKNYGTRERR